MTDVAGRERALGRAPARAIADACDGTAVFATIGDPNLYSTFTYIAHAVRELVPDVVGRDRARDHRDAGPRGALRAPCWPRATSGSR